MGKRTAVKRRQTEYTTYCRSDAVNEVLNQPQVPKAIQDYARMVVAEGQKVRDLFRDQLKWTEENVNVTAASRADAIAGVTKFVFEESGLGDDELAKVIARAIATGDYLW